MDQQRTVSERFELLHVATRARSTAIGYLYRLVTTQTPWWNCGWIIICYTFDIHSVGS